MGDLLLPVGPRHMSTWQDHQERVPTPSSEPGTDWYCPIGTPVLAPGDGVIYGYGTDIGPATGLWNGIDLDNGQRFRAMHYSKLIRKTGRVKRGEVIALSGASGYGVWDWSGNWWTGGAHVHGTLWPTQVSRYGYHWVNGKKVPYTIDFMRHADLSGLAGGGSSPFPPTEPEERDIEMRTIYNKDDKNEETRRAAVGEFTFQVQGKTASARERKLWEEPVDVTQDEWNGILATVNVRRAMIGQKPLKGTRGEF